MCNNESRLVACNVELIDTKRDDYLGALCNNEGSFVENNDADNIKHTNNKSSLGNGNNAKHNDMNNGNNLDYNPSYNNDGYLVKYDYIDTDGIRHTIKTNVDNSTKANNYNE